MFCISYKYVMEGKEEKEEKEKKEEKERSPGGRKAVIFHLGKAIVLNVVLYCRHNNV